MAKEWRDWESDEDCPECGGGTRLYTDIDTPPGCAGDGDLVRCDSCEAEGYIVVYEDDDSCGVDWCLPD